MNYYHAIISTISTRNTEVWTSDILQYIHFFFIYIYIYDYEINKIYKIIISVILLLFYENRVHNGADILLSNYNKSTIRFKRIAISSNDIKHKTPTCINEVITLVKEAKQNNYKITVISGGHSDYMMNQYNKIAYKKIVIIDICNMNKITHNDNILNIETGLLLDK